MWQRCIEFLVVALCAGSAVAALSTAIVAVVSAYFKTKALRTPAPAAKAFAARDHGEEHAARVAENWRQWRLRFADFGKDVVQIANPTRSVAMDMVKESANWGRLGIQYALIGNGGALAALPYLLSQKEVMYKLALADSVWSATWFAIGLSCAAACCLVAYLDFLVNAASYWTSFSLELNLANQRHFETEDTQPVVTSHTDMIAALQATAAKTAISGVTLAFVSWFALAWGAFRLIASMVPA